MDRPKQRRRRFLENPNVRCLYLTGVDTCLHGDIAIAVRLKSLCKNRDDADGWFYICDRHAHVYTDRKWQFEIEEVF